MFKKRTANSPNITPISSYSCGGGVSNWHVKTEPAIRSSVH